MTQNVGKGFDRLASTYDLWVRLVFGKKIEKAQCALLGELPKGGNVLLIGGGTGWLLKPLCWEVAPSRVLYIDASARMIEKAQAFVRREIPAWETKIEFLHGTQEAIAKTDHFDLIITPFFLDLFSKEELEAVFLQLKHQLNPQGTWYLIDFQTPNNFFQIPAQLLIWVMYRFFRFFTGMSGTRLIDPTPYFISHNFRLLHEKLFYLGMIKSQIWGKRSL